jgi:hypothetical protein
MGCGLKPNHGYYLDRLTMFETTFGWSGHLCHRLDLQSKSRVEVGNMSQLQLSTAPARMLQCLSHAEQMEHTAVQALRVQDTLPGFAKCSTDFASVANCQVAATLRAQREARQESKGQNA